MVAINEIVSEAAATFVEDCKAANLKLRKAEPTEKVEKIRSGVPCLSLKSTPGKTGESVTFDSPRKDFTRTGTKKKMVKKF